MSPPRLVVEGLGKRFGGLRAVDEVSFEVEAGECVGLIGPNGAGKTTVFSLIDGSMTADEGRVLLDGQRLDGLPAHRRARRGLARTYQRLEVFPEMTVLEHLLVAQDAQRGATGLLRDLLGRGAPSAEEVGRAERVLEMVGLEDRRESVVGRLSLGTCRLVELARALVTDPRLLLADEPSSGLDAYETAEIGELLRRLVDEQGLTLVIVEHDLELVGSLVDRVVAMDLGRIVAVGAFDEVMASPQVHAAYLGGRRP